MSLAIRQEDKRACSRYISILMQLHTRKPKPRQRRSKETKEEVYHAASSLLLALSTAKEVSFSHESRDICCRKGSLTMFS